MDSSIDANFIPLPLILETIPDALIIMDNHGCIALVNHNTEKLFQRDRGELIGTMFVTLLPERFHNHPYIVGFGHLSNSQNFPVSKNIEISILRFDSEEIPVRIKFRSLTFNGRDFVLATIHDISKLKDAESNFESIFESAPDGLLIANKEGYITLANRQIEKLFGYSNDQIIGKKIEFLMPDRFRSKHINYRQDYLQNPRIRPMGAGLELFGMHKSGDEFPVEISLSPLETDEGTIVLAAIRDISEQTRLKAQLLRQNTELQQIDLAKDRFLACMSHELRTPLNAIIGFTGTLLMKLPGPLNAEQEKQLKTVEINAKYLLSIINDILDLAKIESGMVELELEKVNCIEIIDDVVISLAHFAEVKKIDLEKKITKQDLHAVTDKRALRQILFNLLNNAIKFTDKGYVQIETKIKTVAGREFIEISVQDTGVGIKDENKSKLFSEFKQLEPNRKHGDGTGLGLYLCKKLAELINGTIEFESQYGKGSRFTILIPRTTGK